MTQTIEQLQDMKYDGLIDSLNCCVSESINDQAIKAITTLQAELEQYRKDAERYRWLAWRSDTNPIMIIDCRSEKLLFGYNANKAIDAAIDKAMESV